MKKHDNGGPAFPREYEGSTRGDAFGMTLRDYFAAKALNALLSGAPNGTSFGVNHMDTNMNYSLVAYAIADAMLEARKS